MSECSPPMWLLYCFFFRLLKFYFSLTSYTGMFRKWFSCCVLTSPSPTEHRSHHAQSNIHHKARQCRKKYKTSLFSYLSSESFKTTSWEVSPCFVFNGGFTIYTVHESIYTYVYMLNVVPHLCPHSCLHFLLRCSTCNQLAAQSLVSLW